MDSGKNPAIMVSEYIKKGYGVFVTPMMLQVKEDNEKIELQVLDQGLSYGYANYDFIYAAILRWVLSQGGFVCAPLEPIARKAVNRLLEQLEQPLIQ